MFKIGDKVKCINNTGYRTITNDKEYTVKAIDNQYNRIEIVNDVQRTFYYFDDRFMLVGNGANTVPDSSIARSVFQVGDRVRCIDSSSVIFLNGTTVYLIKNVYKEYIDIRNDNNDTVSYLARRFELVERKANIALDTHKVCVCDSLELFRKGCGCGAIVKRQWGLASQK